MKKGIVLLLTNQDLSTWLLATSSLINCSLGETMTAGDVIDDRFEVIDEIGHGGMGIVLRVRDRTSGSTVALKYCDENDDVFRRRFAREIRVMQMIQHDHVMPVLYANLEHEPPYFTMPIAISSLGSEIRAGMSEADTLAAFKQICLGVQGVHNSNCTHRDIKPDNALRLENGNIVVTDMGLAKIDPRDSTTLTQTVAFVGTRVYCAPEQLGGSRDADARTDIYQLGKTLYEMITGEPPALLDMTKVPNGLAYIIDRATKNHPDQRYQTVGVLMDAIETYIRANAPDVSPDREFEAVFEQAQELLKQGKYRADNLESLIALLLRFEDDADLLTKQFERLPEELLSVMARNFPKQMQRLLETYLVAIESVLGDRGYSYGEYVATKMRIIFDNTDDARLKALTLKVTLVVAVSLNRFAAMDIFDAMLVRITRPED